MHKCNTLVRSWFRRNYEKEATAHDVHEGIKKKYSYPQVGKECKALYLSGEIELVRTEKMHNGIRKKFYRQVT